jgi:hypothetical protein
MQVSNAKIPRDGCVRYIRTITDEPTPDLFNKTQRKFSFLQEVVNDGVYSGILNCGPAGFEKLFMEHNGVAWVIKLESEVFE